MPEASLGKSVNSKVIGWILTFALLFFVGLWVSFQYVESEKERERQSWQIRLGMVADSRAIAIGEWIEANYKTLRDLSENTSLQIYMTELAMNNGVRAKIEDEPAQASYLRNLLTAVAERNGFRAHTGNADISANVERIGLAGIALLDSKLGIITASSGFPSLGPQLQEAIGKALQGKPVFIDMFQGPTNLPALGFAMPIAALQGEASEIIGIVVGIRLLNRDFWNLLKQPGDYNKTAETYLVRRNGLNVEYISALHDNTPAMQRVLALDTANLIDKKALDNPGSFGLGSDNHGEEVLFVSRLVSGTPWVLVRKIDREEALAESDKRFQTIFVVLVVSLISAAIALIAVWRHGASVRAAEAAEKFRITAMRMTNLSKFMRLVTNSQTTQIVAVTKEGKYTFANEPAAREAGISPEEMLGKNMASVIGPVKAEFYASINREVMDDFAVNDAVDEARRSVIHEFADQVIRSEHIPLRGDADYPPAVLMVIDDITAITQEKRKNERIQKELLQTLVRVVDGRDSYSARHCERVAVVAGRIAQEMGVEDEVRKAVDLASYLLNLGKVMIPSLLLTKKEPLLPEEKQMLAGIYRLSAELVRPVEFQEKVAETLEQLSENWDGSGHLGVKGEEILLSARILKIANSFVAMTSPRAWREALSLEKAIGEMQAKAGELFDKKPLYALIHILENKGGRKEWADFGVKL